MLKKYQFRFNGLPQFPLPINIAEIGIVELIIPDGYRRANFLLMI